MKYKSTSLNIQSLNPTLGFGWFTRVSRMKKEETDKHNLIKSEKYNH